MSANNQVRLTRLALVFFLALFAAGMVGVAVVVASSGGRVGYSGNPNSGNGNTCSVCHSGGEIPTVFIDGPTAVAPGETATYTLRIIGGQEVAGGLNVSASSGELATLPGAMDVKLIPPAGAVPTAELTHTGPKAVDEDGVVSFSFTWTAPAEPGMAILYGAGNSVNLDGSPFGDAPGTRQLIINAPSLVYLPVGLSE